ncbi:hypothetical protein P5F11_15045 [Clostridium perfringens]|nr:hypothetical protein [Clostridium perfringens]
MRNNQLKTEILYVEIPFFEWVDGDFELMDEIYNNYLSSSNNIERIKKFIVTDYLTQLDNDELSKMFSNFKSKKLIEKEEEIKRQEEIMQSLETDLEDSDMPF